MMGTTHFESLDPLSNADCWSLLSQIAFQGRRKEDRNRQENIAKKIAKRCKGLPLAAVTLGSLLKKKRTVQEWEEVLNSEIWELEKEKLELFPHLYLSYNELSPPMKRCFSYCAIFPKDSYIYVGELIRMWIAQGFLSGESAQKMELKGQEYVQDLAASSLLQDIDVFDDTIEYFGMHDIVHDFAQHMTKNECLIVEAGINDDTLQNNKEKMSLIKRARHVNWLIGENASISPISLCNVEKLRSLLYKGKISPDAFSNLKCVRVLVVNDPGLEELPPDIGNYLIHLRLLRLVECRKIKKLPPSLCDLYYLETLDLLTGCWDLKELPDEIYKLKTLRHLLVCREVVFPPGVRELNGLKTLNSFKAKGGGSKLAYLENLNQLVGSLYLVIDGLNEESDCVDAQNAQLEKKTNLRDLLMDFVGVTRMDVIEALRPPPNLYRLRLKGCIQSPHWMGMGSLSNNLKRLMLDECSNTLHLSLWNLQSLEELLIGNPKSMECLVSHEFLGLSDLINIDRRRRTTTIATAFPKLKTLRFEFCTEWTEWEDITLTDEEETAIKIMPCLEELYFCGCSKLKSLPHHVLRNTPLKHLNIYGSNLLRQRYKSSEDSGRYNSEFFIPTCQVHF